MKDLRTRLIKLAYNKPDLRPHLLPLLKTADAFEEDVKGKKFKHPETGNDVKFDSLPADEQKKVRKKWKKKNEGKDKKDDKGGDGFSKDLQDALKDVKTDGLSDAEKKKTKEQWKHVKDPAKGAKFVLNQGSKSDKQDFADKFSGSGKAKFHDEKSGLELTAKATKDGVEVTIDASDLNKTLKKTKTMSESDFYSQLM